MCLVIVCINLCVCLTQAHDNLRWWHAWYLEIAYAHKVEICAFALFVCVCVYTCVRVCAHMLVYVLSVCVHV